MNFSFIYLILATLFTVYSLVYTLKKNREFSYLNPFFILVAFITLYLLLPSYFVEEVRYYYEWEFSDQDIFYSNLLVANCALFFSFLLLKFNSVHLKIDTQKQQVSSLIKIIWIIVTTYLIYVVAIKYINGELFFNTNYLGVQDKYKLKNIGYLLITISILYYASVRKFYVFIPNILVVVLDLLEGSRTTAIIVLVPMFITYSIYKSKTYLFPMVSLLSLMIVVGILRTSIDIEVIGIPWYIKALGEFRETYLTIPILISNENFVAHGNIFDWFSSISTPLLQPLREVLLNEFDLAGRYAAREIGRGYGLGSNFITDSLFYGYWFLLVTLFFMTVTFYGMYRLIFKLPTIYILIFSSYFIIFIRLVVREGFYYSLNSMIFVLIIYSLPVLLIKYSIRRENA
ncbi:O-antigen polymerase [Aliarcobacter cryaerophilus]|uniref:O-antigen polymerase n=1 Tax=Aliarcobacter cryaerophilus TaxID=28198 RepID=UPI0021B56ED1|nr:O-antigen polymerase [Aliarcobacter cryaerophilus]MCT7481725.1 oligosaccharide repeat unit polymerase [Aliarcobacter cryaerophilus]